MRFDWPNIADIVSAQAAERPEGEALLAGQRKLTWAQLARATEDAAAYLDGLGIMAGETVGLALANTIEHVVLLLGLMRLGAAPLGFPPETPAEQIRAVLQEHKVRVLFREPHEREALAPATVSVPPHWLPPPAEPQPRAVPAGNDLRILFLSSGSTGTPRVVTLTHAALLQRARLSYPAYADHWSARHPGTALVAGSIAHAAFIQWWLQQMLLGGRSVLLPLYFRGGDLVREIAQWDDAVLRTVPNTCRLLLQAAPAEGLLLPRMRFLNCTGLPLYPEEKRAMLRRVAPCFSEDYGASGVGPITCLASWQVAAKAESVGPAPIGVEIRLGDDAGRPAPPGMAGRIEVRSPGMTPPALQALYRGSAIEGFHDGWYRTGDVGRLDADGFLHFVGRAGQCIRQNGVELYPEEIEAALSSFAGIADIVVVGHVPPGRGSEVAVAIVSGLGFAQRFAIERHCADRLPRERRPAHYLFAEQLPRTANGKIDRPALKAYLAANPAVLSG